MADISFSVIIPAAGLGRRTGEPVPKPWLELGPQNEPMVVMVLRSFAGLPGLHKVALALHPDELDRRRRQLDDSSLPRELLLCSGGKRRQDSVDLALDEMQPGEEEIIVIHDAARPFVPRELILQVVEKAAEGQAAIAAIPSPDTIKAVDRVGFVTNTPPRQHLWCAQTPQAVRAGILKRGLQVAAQRDIELTDDASAAELMGFRVAVVLGTRANFKITTAEDLAYARFILDQKASRD